MGEPSECMWVITSGLVHWYAPTTAGAGDIELRLRKGDVIGAQDAMNGEGRTATVVARVQTTALELGAADLKTLAEERPQILFNVIRALRERLVRTSAQTATADRGEEIALITGPSLKNVVAPLVAAARTATPRPITFLDSRMSFAGTLSASDQAANEHATVLMPSELDPDSLPVLLEEVDRVVMLLGSASEAQSVASVLSAPPRGRLEIVLVSDEAENASTVWPSGARELVVRICSRASGDFPLRDDDARWLARHLTRTKLGLALGAGGAKGYAHIGVLQVLEEAGYEVDNVGGSSIGGFVATHVALGYDSAETDARFRAAFNPETVSTLFSNPLGGGSVGIDTLTRLLKGATEDRFFSHAVMPLVVMALDLDAREALPIRQGSLWEALTAALAVAGVFPAQDRGGHRLVDAIALVPVPSAAVYEDGADLAVSVNLLGGAPLEKWPGLEDEAAEEPKKRRRGMLDTMLEVMDLGQLDTSKRLADLADVAITPRFGPADWRDFHLADRFLAAGRAAAEEQLPKLQALCRPVDLEAAHRQAAVASPI